MSKEDSDSMDKVSTDLVDAPVIDRETVDMLREMDMIADDRNLLLELVDDFLSHSAQLIEEIILYLTKQNLPELASKAHSLKGASLNIGALALFTVCDEIEATARRHQRIDTEIQLPLLNHAYTRTTETLIEIRKRAQQGEDIDDLLG